MIRFFQKYHKWLGLIITLLLVLFAASGIVLNHRSIFASIDIDRDFLPDTYGYENWNLAAVSGAEEIGSDSILVYGNIGIWLTDSSFTDFTDYSQGFPTGIDNKKISKIYKTREGRLFAGTLMGLFEFNSPEAKWHHVSLPLHNQRIVDLTQRRDTLIVLSRSYLLKSTDYRNFTKQMLPPPDNYDGKVGLFRTLWIIHSGEVYGEVGKLFIDLVGVTFIFLSITGLIPFINGYRIRSRKIKHADVSTLKKSTRWNLVWHNRIGWISLLLLTITTATGMFLRPPLLIAIAGEQVGKLPYTTLDTDNAWFDSLRRIIYDDVSNRFIIGTNRGIYYSDDDFNSTLHAYTRQPPVSVMGINVFEKVSQTELLVGSFSGLFLWNTQSGMIRDYISNASPQRSRSPIGQHVVTGYIGETRGNEVYFDYGSGANTLGRNRIFPAMPPAVRDQPISLWNFMLEVHTARIFQPLIGNFYILIIPILGILSLFVLISGFIVWYKRHRKNRLSPGALAKRVP